MILVTGASGFLGHHIIDELLAAGYELRALVRNSSNRQFAWSSMVEVVEGDVLDLGSLEKALEGIDTVVHAASVVSYWRKRHREMRKINVEGTANLVNLCIEQGINKWVHVSSIAALGKDTKEKWITEETPWNAGQTASAYAQSKYDQELEVYRGIAEGLEAVIVNPGLILGKTHNWQANTGKLFSVVSGGLSYVNRGSTGVVGAMDVARSIRLLLEKEVPAGERFVLVGENVSQKKLLGKIAKALGVKPPTRTLAPWLSMTVGYLSQLLARFSGKEPVITPETMRSSLRGYLYNGEKICQYGFSYDPLDEVIQQTARAYLEAN